MGSGPGRVGSIQLWYLSDVHDHLRHSLTCLLTCLLAHLLLTCALAYLLTYLSDVHNHLRHRPSTSLADPLACTTTQVSKEVGD